MNANNNVIKFSSINNSIGNPIHISHNNFNHNYCINSSINSSINFSDNYYHNYNHYPYYSIKLNIYFYMKFTTGQAYLMCANPKTLFQIAFDRFIKKYDIKFCNNKKIAAICNGERIDFKKSLLENNINQNDSVVLCIETQKNSDQKLDYPGLGFKLYAQISMDGNTINNEKKINQDISLIHLNVGNIKGFNLFGVLDGHGQNGHLVSTFCKDYFIKKFDDFANKCKIESIYNPEEIYNQLKITNFKYIIDCFNNADKEMKNNNQFDISSSGTTCNLVIQLNNNLICANVGDSRAILIYDNDTKTNQGIFTLSQDDTPNLPAEKIRIINNGGIVNKLIDENGNRIGVYRVFKKGDYGPGLAISRALGNLIAKTYGVISEPKITEYKKNHNAKFMLICSDGIWKYLTNERVRDLGNAFYPIGEIKLFCNHLIENAILEWRKIGTYRDDITVVCVFFN